MGKSEIDNHIATSENVQELADKVSGVNMKNVILTNTKANCTIPLHSRIEKRLNAAKSMRNLANEIRSPDTRMVSTDGALARIAEAIAVLLEELP